MKYLKISLLFALTANTLRITAAEADRYSDIRRGEDEREDAYRRTRELNEHRADASPEEAEYQRIQEHIALLQGKSVPRNVYFTYSFCSPIRSAKKIDFPLLQKIKGYLEHPLLTKKEREEIEGLVEYIKRNFKEVRNPYGERWLEQR